MMAPLASLFFVLMIAGVCLFIVMRLSAADPLVRRLSYLVIVLWASFWTLQVIGVLRGGAIKTMAEHPPIISDNAVLGLMTLLITTLAALWRANRDQQQTLTMLKAQHQIEVEDRRDKAAEARAERAVSAEETRVRLQHEAELARLRLELAAAIRAPAVIPPDEA